MSQKSSASPIQFSDDGFSITATEPWFKVKVQLVQKYLHSFVANAASRADEIIFVDLFSGSGLYSVGHQKEIFAASCLSSLQTDLPIDKWIFCESDADQVSALKARINRFFRFKNVVIVEADQHELELVDKLRTFISLSKGSYKVAVFCVVDPFSIEIPFATLKALAAMGCSFLIPFTFSLNNRHNHEFYLTEQKDKLKRYAGGDIIRSESVQSNFHFYKRLVKSFQNNMLVEGLNSSMSVHKLNSALMDLPMFYIGYFSKQVSPRLIQHDVQTAVQRQFELF